VQSQRELASIVEQRRRALQFTQSHLAKQSGVSRQWVNALEAGDVNPSFTNLLALLDALDLKLVVVESEQRRQPVPLPDLDELVNQRRLLPRSL